MARNDFKLTGLATIRLINSNGRIVYFEKIKNLITTNGDLYYASRSAAAVVPATPADVTKVTGMKLGTGSTTPTKSGAASALGTYKSGSNIAFSATYPTVAAIGSDVGYRITYYCSWAPGVATDTALTEAVIVNNAASDSTSNAAATIARITFPAINKQVGDTLAISWAHDFFGA